MLSTPETPGVLTGLRTSLFVKEIMMARYLFFVFCLLSPAIGFGQDSIRHDFAFGNVRYVNLDRGEIYYSGQTPIEILGSHNHYVDLRIGSDTLSLKVARRSPATTSVAGQVFVADCRGASRISGNDPAHGLLKKEVLLGISPGAMPLIDPYLFVFPVTFTDGYIWKTLEETSMFSYLPDGKETGSWSYAGVGIDMLESRAMQKHAVIAMESGRVVWIETGYDTMPLATICIESESSPGIYYIYEHLHDGELLIRRNDRVVRGDALGYAWGTGGWNHFRLTVTQSDTIPVYATRHHHAINFYPQLLDLYFGRQPVFTHTFTKGQIYFGRPDHMNGNSKNVSAYESRHGTGWLLGPWNPADKVEWVSARRSGNARLRKTLFLGQPAQCVNPHDHYEFEINVRPGVYRIRALVGDHVVNSWQKVEFEGVVAGTFEKGAGDLDWTGEKIVRVRDGKLTVRIHLKDNMVAGLAEIVFQMAHE